MTLLADSDLLARPFRLLPCSIWGILLLILIPQVPPHLPITNGFQRIASDWVEPRDQHQSSPEAKWPDAPSTDVYPVPVHSHNDYWRRVPLLDALAVGCQSVEADIWLKDGDLLVGHSEDSLNTNRTLRSLYLDPLTRLLEHQNGTIYITDPETPLVLLIDIKTDGAATWPPLMQQLEPLRDKGWLSNHNGTSPVTGPITVVGTGNTPFDMVLSNTARDVFFDAPLNHLSSSIYNTTNSYYASIALGAAIGRTWLGRLSAGQERTVDAQTQLAAQHGLKARYWDTPAWPIAWRDRIWSDLLGHGAEVLNADDILAASRWDWDWCVVLGVNLC